MSHKNGDVRVLFDIGSYTHKRMSDLSIMGMELEGDT
jgi:hypothetical protein